MIIILNQLYYLHLYQFTSSLNNLAAFLFCSKNLFFLFIYNSFFYSKHKQVFYQIQSIMYTPNKKKSYRERHLRQSYTFESTPENNLQDFSNFQTPQRHRDKQNLAKGMLIEIGQSDMFLSLSTKQKKQLISINSWVGQSQMLFESKNTNNFVTPFLTGRNTRSMTQQIGRQPINIESNTIFKLKQALKKLQSPQKKKSNASKSSKENKTVILQSLLKKRNNGTKVGDLIRIRQCSNEKGNNSKEKIGNRKISTSNTQREKCSSLFRSGTKPLELKLMNQLFNFKEARKSRTLKNILQ